MSIGICELNVSDDGNPAVLDPPNGSAHGAICAIGAEGGSCRIDGM